MVSKLKNLVDSESGVAAVEFALILLPLLLIIFGIINFGVLLSNQAIITNAAREGARWASIHSTATYGNGCSNSYSLTPVDPCQVAYTYASSKLINFSSSDTLQASITSPAVYTRGAPQSISVIYIYSEVGWVLGISKQYDALSVMLHE